MRPLHNLGVYIELALYYLRIADTLPVDIIRAIPIDDNAEPLHDLKGLESVLTSSQVTDSFYARASVCSFLETAASKLPSGYRLLIIEAYRSPERQRFLWNEALALVRGRQPNLSNEELEKQARRFVAQPSKRIGGHQTGGAIDLTLADDKGNELFLGTRVQEFNKQTHTRAWRISKEAKRLRGILKNVMTSVGFINYPGEWWHFTYGDQMWAAYSRSSRAIYGAATPPITEKPEY